MKDVFFKVDVQYFEKLHKFHDLLFLPERMRIEKVEKFKANLHEKTEYVIHLLDLKQALNHGLVLKKFIKWLNLIKMLGFSQALWLKPYTDINTDLRKKTKNYFEKDFFKLRKHRDTKLVTTERSIKYLVSEPNFDTTRFFTVNILAIKMKKQRYLWINKNFNTRLK